MRKVFNKDTNRWENKPESSDFDWKKQFDSPAPHTFNDADYPETTDRIFQTPGRPNKPSYPDTAEVPPHMSHRRMSPSDQISTESSHATLDALDKITGDSGSHSRVQDILNTAHAHIPGNMALGRRGSATPNLVGNLGNRLDQMGITPEDMNDTFHPGGDHLSAADKASGRGNFDALAPSKPSWQRQHTQMSFEGSRGKNIADEGMDLLKATFSQNGIRYKETQFGLGSGEQGMRTNSLIVTQKLRDQEYKTGFFTGSRGVNYFFNPENPNMVYPVLPQYSTNKQNDLLVETPLERIVNAAKAGPMRSVLTGQFKANGGNQRSFGVSVSRLVGQPNLEHFYSQSVQGKMDDNLLSILNEGRNEPYQQGATGVAAPASAYNVFRPIAMVDEVWRSAIDKIKRRKTEMGDVDLLRSRNDSIPYGDEPGYFENQIGPNKGYAANIFYDAFSPLAEGQGITASLFAARPRRGMFNLPAGSTYSPDEGGIYTTPSGASFGEGDFFGSKLGRLNNGERIGGRADFSHIFGTSMGSYKSVAIEALTPQFDETGAFTGQVAAKFIQTTDNLSIKSGAIKNFMRRVNTAGMGMAEADAEMRLPGASALPRLGMQVLMAQYPTTGALKDWFSGVASGQGKSEDWINRNFRGGRFSNEAAPMVLQAGVENILNRLLPFERRDQELDPQTYEALKNASFTHEGTPYNVIPNTEGNVTTRYDEDGTAVGHSIKQMWGLGAVLPTSINARAEFNRNTMSISPSVMSVLAQYEPERFEALNKIGDLTRSSNRALNVVQSYRANYSEAQADTLRSTFGVSKVSPEEISQMQERMISANPHISQEGLSENILRELKDTYGKQSLSLDINGKETFLPSAGSALSGVEHNGWGMQQAKLLQAYGSGDQEGINASLSRFMGTRDGAGKFARNSLGFIANSATTLRKALSINMPRLGGLGTAVGGIDPNTAVLSGRNLMHQLGVKDLDSLRGMTTTGELNGLLTRDPFSKVDEYAAGMKIGLYEDQSEKFRNENPDPGQGMYISPVAGSAAQGDFDADRYKLILNAAKAKGGLFLANTAQRFIPNSEMIERAKNKFESEWHKNVQEFSDRSTQYGDIDALKKSFADPKKLFPMLFSEMGQKFAADQKSGSKGVGATYNSFLRNAFGSANAAAEGLGGFAQKAVLQSNSVLYHRAVQAGLDAEAHDPEMDFLRDVLTTGTMQEKGKERTFSYRSENKFKSLGTETAAAQTIFESVANIGRGTSDEEYITTGLSRGVATSLLGMEQLATHSEPEKLISQMEGLLMDRRAGQDVSRQMLDLTGRKKYQSWLFGDEGEDSRGLSSIAHSVVGRFGEYAQRKGTALAIRPIVRQAGELFTRAKLYKDQVEKATQGVEGVAQGQASSSAMQSYVQSRIPADNSSTEEMNSAAVSSVSSDVSFSNSINTDLGETPGQVAIPAGIGGSGGGRRTPPSISATPEPEEPGKLNLSGVNSSGGNVVRAGGTQVVKQAIMPDPTFRMRAAGAAGAALTNLGNLKERLNSPDIEVAKAALKQYGAIEQAANYVTSVGNVNRERPERNEQGLTRAENSPSYRNYQRAIGDQGHVLFNTLEDLKNDAMGASGRVAESSWQVKGAKVSSAERGLNALPLSEFGDIMSKAQAGDRGALSEVRGIHRKIRSIQMSGGDVPSEYSGFVDQIAEVAGSSSSRGGKTSAIYTSDESKLAMANAAQGYLGKNISDVPRIVEELNKAISGMGNVSEETTKKAKNFVKAYKDSSDELEEAIKVKRAGGTLSPKQESLLGGLSADMAEARHGVRGEAAARVSGALYGAGMATPLDEPSIDQMTGDGSPSSLGGRILGAGQNAYDRIIKGQGFFHSKLAYGMLIAPVVKEAQQYQQYQAGIGQQLYQTGNLNYDQLMAGQYGTITRRDAQFEQARLAFGQQALSAYSPFINAALSPAASNGIAGAAVGIGLPALGAGVIASSLLGSPLAGGVVAGGAALIGAAGYIQTAINPTDIRDKLAAGQQNLTHDSGNIHAQLSSILDNARDPMNTAFGLVKGNPLNITSGGLIRSSPYPYDQPKIDANTRLYQATQDYISGAYSKANIASKYPDVNISDVISGGYDKIITAGGLSEGAQSQEGMNVLSSWMTYQTNAPSPDKFKQLLAVERAGGDATQLALARAQARGISPYNKTAIANLQNKASDQLDAIQQAGGNVGLYQQQQVLTNQSLDQINAVRRQGGLPEVNADVMGDIANRRGTDIAGALTNSFGVGGQVNLQNPKYYQQYGMSLDKQAQAAIMNKNFGLGSRIQANEVSGSDYFTQMGAAGASQPQISKEMATFNSFVTPEAQTLRSQILSGNRYAISRAAGIADNYKFQTMNTDTGMGIYYQNIPQANIDNLRSDDTYGLLKGASNSDLAMGERGWQNQIRLAQRSQQRAGFFANNTQRDIGYNLMTGNLSQVSELMARTSGDLPGYKGMAFDQGNGMGTWQIEDAQRNISREQQRFSYSQGTQSLQIAEGEYQLQGQQFNTNWSLQQRQMQYQNTYQQQQIGIDRSHQIQQTQWSQEDLNYNRNQLDVHFGWQMEDYTRNIRYARGMDKRNLMREQSRAVVEYGMQAGQSDREQSRLTERKKWDDEAYQRQVDYFTKNKEFQKEALDNQKFFFDKGRAFDRERLDMQQMAHMKELTWMNETFVLEDQQRHLERQNQVDQYNMQVAIDAKTQATAETTNRYNDYLTRTGDVINQINSFIDVLIFKAQFLNALFATPSPGGNPPTSGGGHMYSGGGYTGMGGKNDKAGIVHKGEWVVPQEGAMVVRGSDPMMNKLVDLMEKSVKIQVAIAQKESSFTAVLGGQATKAVPMSSLQSSRARFN